MRGNSSSFAEVTVYDCKSRARKPTQAELGWGTQFGFWLVLHRRCGPAGDEKGRSFRFAALSVWMKI